MDLETTEAPPPTEAPPCMCQRQEAEFSQGVLRRGSPNWKGCLLQSAGHRPMPLSPANGVLTQALLEPWPHPRVLSGHLPRPQSALKSGLVDGWREPPASSP